LTARSKTEAVWPKQSDTGCNLQSSGKLVEEQDGKEITTYFCVSFLSENRSGAMIYLAKTSASGI